MAEEALISFVLETLRDFVIEEARFLGGVEAQVERLQQELNHMRCFLRVTDEANQDGRKRVLEWVLRVRDIAYEAENVIETYVFKVASRRRGGIVGNIKRFAGGLNECYHRHAIGSDIDTLLSKISDLTNSIDRYGIRQIMENRDEGASRRPLLRSTYSVVTDEDELFVGYDDSINMLAEKLVSDQYRTVCLYGMGGLGKTTLARKVYRHPVVIKHFDGFSWVSISKKWQKDDIWRGILIKLMPDQKRDDIEKWRDEELVRKLSQYLRNKKCLVVLDDIWSIDAWNEIKFAIPIKENGSKLFLTTRNMEVGTLVDANGYKHEPKLLTVDESWELLRNKALRGQDSNQTTQKEKIGKEMIAHCYGLPLAVVALGGILSSKISDDEWLSVCNNFKSYLRKVRQGQENVETILALSYDDLPSQLKPCFLYLSKYAEDVDIEVETLYQYWMAEGMVSSEDRRENDETIMDVAEHYLNELAERSMVFVQKEEEYTFTKIKSCRLHDLMRDMCISKAKEEKFLEATTYEKIQNLDEGGEACRLSVSFTRDNNAKRSVPHAKAVRRTLRSLILDGHRNLGLKFNFSEFVMLRVLSLDDAFDVDFDAVVDVAFDDDDSVTVCKLCGTVCKFCGIMCGWFCHTTCRTFELFSIRKLLHLRYLKLSGVFIMPSIDNLKQLQTLDLRGCGRFRWISDVWNLPRLNHLYLPATIELGSKKLGFDGMLQLEILKGFTTKTCNVKHLSTLKNLRKLEARVKYTLGDLEELINQVRKLTHLRVLELIIEKVDLSSEKAEAIMNDILSYSNLVTLEIEGKLSKFPEYDTGLCRNLRSLTLWKCEIEEDPVRTLERLPKLRTLHLYPNSYVGKEMSCHASGFPQLRVLEMWLLYNLEKWEIEDGAMPNLTKLTISGCLQLSMIPAGLRSNTLLKELNIGHMEKEFQKRVEVNEEGEEGPDFHKVRHVPTIRMV